MADDRQAAGEPARGRTTCVLLLLFYCVCLGGAIDLIVEGRFLVEGILLAPFAVVEASQYVLALLERPTLDRRQEGRLVDTMNGVATAAGLGEPDGTVQVQTLLHSPLRISPRRRLIMADAAFVEHLNDAQLRAVSGYGVGCYLFPPATWMDQIYAVMSAALGAGVGLAAVSTRSIALALALFPFAAWVITTTITVVASFMAARLYRHTDGQSAAILGDNAEVAMGLDLVGDARRTLQLSESTIRRVVRRCIQPISPSWHEEERSRFLRSAPIPSLEMPRPRPTKRPKPPEPQYEP